LIVDEHVITLEKPRGIQGGLVDLEAEDEDEDEDGDEDKEELDGAPAASEP
jgi:hypothetical protein